MLKHRLTNTPAPVAPQTPGPVASTSTEFDEAERECSDEEDFELLIGFDPENAKQRLFSMSNSIQLSIR